MWNLKRLNSETENRVVASTEAGVRWGNWVKMVKRSKLSVIK